MFFRGKKAEKRQRQAYDEWVEKLPEKPFLEVNLQGKLPSYFSS